jgi:hypothetical protein
MAIFPMSPPEIFGGFSAGFASACPVECEAYPTGAAYFEVRLNERPWAALLIEKIPHL